MPDTIVMDPQAVLDVAFDWSGWLADFETISTKTITATGVTAGSPTESAGVVTVWLSAAVAGVASVACKIVTNQGRTDERTMTIRVRNR
jgi:hypothetical protein